MVSSFLKGKKQEEQLSICDLTWMEGRAIFHMFMQARNSLGWKGNATPSPPPTQGEFKFPSEEIIKWIHVPSRP